LTGVFSLCFINADVRNQYFCVAAAVNSCYTDGCYYCTCSVMSLVWLHCSSYVSYLMLHLIVVQMGEDTHRVHIPASFSIGMCQCQIQSAAAWLIYIQTHIFPIDEIILCHFPPVLCECEAVTLILMEEHRMSVFECRVLNGIFRRKRLERSNERMKLIICILRDEQVKEDGMFESCNTNGGYKKRGRFWS
jgi:hypothetical protein